MSLLTRAARRPAGAAALTWLGLVAVAAAAAPVFSSYGPLDNDLANVLAGPSGDHLLGTDSLGRDVLSRLLYGARVSLTSVVVAVVVFLVLGTVLGLAAGYLRGWVDWVVTRLADLMYSLPGIVVVLVVLSVFANNANAAMITFGVLGSPGMVRVLRAQTLALREEPYVAAAQVAGLRRDQVLRRHLLPRLAGTVIVQVAVFAAVAVTIESGLGFLGFGAQPPDPSWGGLVREASELIDRHPWLLVPAGVPLVLTVLALGMLGDAVRDASTETWAVSRMAKPRPVKAAVMRSVLDPDPLALLSVRNLTIEIGGVPVVQDVGFDVHAGQALGVVGESGCGKSVTALGVLGLVPGGGRVTGGQVVFDGRVLNEDALRDVRGTGIAYISQEPMVALDPTFSVGAQLSEAVRRHEGGQRSKVRGRVLELLGQVGLPDPAGTASRYPHELSGGMAQRVAIALALAGRPRLLIADEPTTALDVTVQAEILALLRRLQEQQGMAVLIVTHDWGVVADLCRNAVVMYAGQVVESGDIEDLFDRPAHPYTEGLLAANPQLAAVGEPLRTIPGTVPAPRDWPSGCRFADRCRYTDHACTAGPVPLAGQGPGRFSRCVHTERLLVNEGGSR